MNAETNRDKIIIDTSIKGIVVNLILVAFKATVGLMSNSIAIILDAVNNLSDALSQIITIVGTKLSQRRPDQEHPYGYGRIEYISSAIVAVIVLLAGFTSLKESVLKIIEPEAASYTIPTIIIVGVGVTVKFFFGSYVKRIGQKIDSQALVAAGTDGFMDAILSFSVFVAAIIGMTTGINLEGILGAVLSIFIIKAGFGILMETLGSLIGDRADSEFTQMLKKEIRDSYEEVIGAYDLVLHDYGPARSIGTVHVELKNDMTADEIHHLSKKIIADVHQKYGILLTVGIYATNYEDPETKTILNDINTIRAEYENVMGVHGLNVDKKRMVIDFDIPINFREKDPDAIASAISERVTKLHPDYKVKINIDSDFSD